MKWTPGSFDYIAYFFMWISALVCGSKWCESLLLSSHVHYNADFCVPCRIIKKIGTGLDKRKKPTILNQFDWPCENVIYVRGQTWKKLCDNTIRYHTYKTLYPWGKGPFGDENSVRMKDSVWTNMSRDHIAAQNGRVVCVRIFSPLALCYRLPVVIEGVLGGPDFHAD